MKDDETKWHLDRRVPLALIIAILFQTGAALWWAAGVNARVDHLERQSAINATNPERIVRLETKVDTISQTVVEIKTLIQRPR